MPRSPSARVRVPASTSNLGPGFDVLGLALDLYLDVEVRREGDQPAHFEHLGGEAAGWPAPPDNLLNRSLRAAGLDDRGLVFRVESEIPTARGLGSSAAAIVAGVLLADALLGRSTPRPDLLQACLPLEGHPDNLTPALLGGLQACFPGGTARTLPLHPDLALAVAWPDRPLSTERARAALPASVAHADAVHNAGRLCALTEGLRSGDPQLLRLGAEDRLHEPFRLPLIPGAALALERARTAGAYLAVLSGSGSALFAIAPKSDLVSVCDALVQGFADAGEAARSRRVRSAPGAALA